MATISWQHVWLSVASDLDDSLTAGLGHLLTEDVLRFATSKALLRNGVRAERLANEWRQGSGPTDAVDLVIATEPRAAIEFKYPREPREKNAAWTLHLGELLKDFYRLAYMSDDFEERWCVQLLTPRLQRYLIGVQARHQVRVAVEPGGITRLDPAIIANLPLTAGKLLARWSALPAPVIATCTNSLQVGDLALVVHAVEPSKDRPGPAELHR